jgi:hypothetical protein
MVENNDWKVENMAVARPTRLGCNTQHGEWDVRRGTSPNWFDPIESNLRGRERGFLETTIEEECASALSAGRAMNGGGQAIARLRLSATGMVCGRGS